MFGKTSAFVGLTLDGAELSLMDDIRTENDLQLNDDTQRKETTSTGN